VTKKKQQQVISAVVNGANSNDLTVICTAKQPRIKDCGLVQLRKFEIEVDYRVYVHGTIEVNAEDHDTAIQAVNEILDSGRFTKDLRKHEVREITDCNQRTVFRSWDKQKKRI
jgi:hypothetical protein